MWAKPPHQMRALSLPTATLAVSLVDNVENESEYSPPTSMLDVTLWGDKCFGRCLAYTIPITTIALPYIQDFILDDSHEKYKWVLMGITTLFTAWMNSANDRSITNLRAQVNANTQRHDGHDQYHDGYD
jgi:hypothetical protein